MKTNVFQHSAFTVLALRLARLCLISQFLEPGHKVLQDELQLIAEARAKIKAHLAATVPPSWKRSAELRAFVLMFHVRNLVRERLELHDVDDEVRDEAVRRMRRIRREWFSELLPVPATAYPATHDLALN